MLFFLPLLRSLRKLFKGNQSNGVILSNLANLFLGLSFFLKREVESNKILRKKYSILMKKNIKF